MTTTGFDLAAYKTAQQRDWTTTAQGRQQFHAVSHRQWWQVSHGLLERARVTPGQRLWDVTTGIGQPALTAATLLGARGRVLGTDLSPAMIRIATERAHTRPRQRRVSTSSTPTAWQRPPTRSTRRWAAGR